MSNFHEVLRACRENKKLTQKEVATAIGITERGLRRYEAGEREPDFDRLRQIADYFGVSIDFLTGKTEEKEDEKVSLTRRRRNWYCAIDLSVLQSSLSTSEKFLYIVLQAFLGPPDAEYSPQSSFPSNEELSLLTGYSVETVVHSLKSLEEKKILSRHEENGSPTVYVNDISEKFLSGNPTMTNEGKRNVAKTDRH